MDSLVRGIVAAASLKQNWSSRTVVTSADIFLGIVAAANPSEGI
jgi:hypothetical protein